MSTCASRRGEEEPAWERILNRLPAELGGSQAGSQGPEILNRNKESDA